jgi:thymidine phosphorylase
VHHVKAAKSGCLQSLDALLVGRTAVALGAGRDKKSDPVDLSAGIIIHKKPGETVAPGEPILELRYNDESRLNTALGLAQQAAVIGDRAPVEAAQMIGWVHDAGEQMFVALP